MRRFSKIAYLGLVAVLAFLTACSSTTPKCVEQTQVVTVAPEVPASVESSSSSSQQNRDPVAKVQESTLAPSVEYLPLPAQTDTVPRVNIERADPYIEIQKIVASAFSYADSMLAAGEIDSVSVALERLTILNPLWQGWMQRAEKTVASARGMAKENAERFSSLAMMIVNENATNANYRTVKELADSLVSLAPGDSLVAFANKQVLIAYSKSYKKANSEKIRITQDAEKSGDFAKADSLAGRLLLRYRDFADTLKLEEWVEHVHALAVVNSMDADYWKKNSPAEAMAQAENLARQGNYAEAKNLYLKLASSPERVSANTALIELGNNVCNDARKSASTSFAKALSSKKTEDRNANIEKAIDFLDTCLANFPESSEAAKAKEDLKTLKKELK